MAGIEGTERVLGLYCGSGSIELFLARHVREVRGIDVSSESISCAKANAAINEVGNCLFVRDRVEKVRHHLAGMRPDIVVVDPPRAGLSKEALDVIVEIGAEKVVYISCNPATLARDLKGLKREYGLRHAIPFDFFPHTGHFEVLTLLERIW